MFRARNLKPEGFVEAATKIADEARKRGIFLRLLGALAVRIHCPGCELIHKKLGREFSDLDYVGYSKQTKEIDRLFSDLKYEKMHTMQPVIFVGRRIYIDPSGSRPDVDIFFDKIHMNHEIDFKGRLEVDFPTIPLCELVLTKTQIVKINEKDIKDIAILFLEHEVGEDDKETINAKRVAKLLSNDWGFYYTVTANFEKTKNFLSKFQVLSNKQNEHIVFKIDKLLDYIEKEPKSFRWKLRARVGTKQKWYDEVEEVERAEWLNRNRS
jgi:hypothetical protein